MSDLDKEDLSRVQRNGPYPLPDLYMPAMPPLGLIHAVERWVALYRRRRRFQRHVRPLLAQSDRILADMGCCRDDIVWALRLPLGVDAQQALLERQKRRGAVDRAPGDRR